MPSLRRNDSPPDSAPLRALGEKLGFVPNLFAAQSLVPRVVDAEAALTEAIVLAPGALSSREREEILLAVSGVRRDRYGVAVHARVLRGLGCPDEILEALAGGTWAAVLSPGPAALLDFAAGLGAAPWAVGSADIERLRSFGIPDAAILEVVQASALARLLGAVATGLAVEPDFSVPAAVERLTAPAPASAREKDPPPARRPAESPLKAVALAPEVFPPFALLKKAFGFIPLLYRAQTLRPDALEAEIRAIDEVLLTENALDRRRKEFILLAVSGANLSSYHVAVHGEILRALGVDPQAADRIATDHRRADLPEVDRALLDFAVKLAMRPWDHGAADVQALSEAGFREAEILDAIVMTGLSSFLNGLDAGLMPRPDFRPRRDLAAERAAAESAAAVHVEDPDAPLVALACAGDAEAFGALVRRHQALVYRTLVGLTGSPEDAEDGSQAVFVNAFRKIRDFEGAARFSTWLTRIAIREGLERLRRRRPTESLDEPGDDEGVRPSRLEAWIDDPERLYAREETRRIVRQELARLPVLYRAAVMLRDIEQLSTAEAAAALEVPEATLKTRLLRGRLMMREALAAYFAGGRTGD